MDYAIVCFFVMLIAAVSFVVLFLTQYAVDQIKEYIKLMIETINSNEYEYKNRNKNNATCG